MTFSAEDRWWARILMGMRERAGLDEVTDYHPASAHAAKKAHRLTVQASRRRNRRSYGKPKARRRRGA